MNTFSHNFVQKKCSIERRATVKRFWPDSKKFVNNEMHKARDLPGCKTAMYTWEQIFNFLVTGITEYEGMIFLLPDRESTYSYDIFPVFRTQVHVYLKTKKQKIGSLIFHLNTCLRSLCTVFGLRNRFLKVLEIRYKRFWVLLSV